jgi:iron complex outermembrane recepter protein
VDATLSCFEAQVNYQITPELHSLIQLDYVRARSDNGNLPRTPPMRALIKGTYQTNDYMAQVSLQHVFEQDNVAAEESHTDAYSLLNANFNYYMDVQNVDLVLYAQVKNLFDEYAQVHTSFLKDEAPLAGRNIKVGIRGQF